jgi:hypothetical protein
VLESAEICRGLQEVMVSLSKSVGVAVGVFLLAALSAHAQLPEEQRSQRAAAERFLTDAEITDSVQFSEKQGVTRPHKLTLQLDGETRFALWKNPSGRPAGHVEGWRYEIAAYRLDGYLGLGMVPPTVERDFKGNSGSCQAWATYWKHLREIKSEAISTPPERVREHNRGVYLQRAFDNLIANVDRHLGNILVTEDWQLILIDHSRSFRVDRRHKRKLIYTAEHREGPRLMKQLPRTFVERLEALDSEQLDEVVADYLTAREKEAVLARRVLVLRDIAEQIAQNGEDQVLY